MTSMLHHRFASRRALSLVALVWVISASPLLAQQQPPAQAPPAGGQAPAQPGATGPQKPNYGTWWLGHARDIDPRPPGWLIHSEGTGSFANQTGSVSGFEITFNALSAQRKDLVTNQVGASIILQEARLEGDRGNFSQKTVRLFDMVFYNITKQFDVATAVIWEKEDPKFLVHRFGVFEGISRHVALSKGRIVGLTAAIGYEDEHFLTPGGPIDSHEGSPTAYFQNTYNAPVQMRGMFNHFVEAFYDLAHTHDYRINWNIGLNLQVNSHIGIGPSLQIRYDHEPVAQTQKLDTLLVFGVNFK